MKKTRKKKESRFSSILTGAKNLGKKAFSKTVELGKLAKGKTEQVIHDKKKEIALGVLSEVGMKENVSQKEAEKIVSPAYNLIYDKYANGGGVGEISWWEVELKMPNGEIVYEDVMAENEEDAEYYGELTDSANEGGEVISVRFKGIEKTYADGGGVGEKMTKARELGITEFPYIEYDSNGRWTYYEDSSGFWKKWQYDSNGNVIYVEFSDGDWKKYEYDSNGKKTYLEDSSGYWEKREYDSNGKKTYLEDSNGYWEKREFDSKGNLTYNEYSSGYWEKWEYDSKGNKTYREDSDGDWTKYEYDSKGNVINFEEGRKKKYAGGGLISESLDELMDLI